MAIVDKIISGRISVGRLGLYLHGKTEHGYHIDFNFTTSPELRACGVNNITRDQLFVLFADFDDITYEKLKQQLDFVNKNYGVSHFIILRTGENRYHVISFEKFLMKELLDLLQNTFVDYTYKYVAVKSDKGWILRISEKKDLDGNVVRDKPQFVESISYSKIPKRRLSRAHIEFFSKLYPEIMEFAKGFSKDYWDEYTMIQLLRYGTSHENLIAKFDLEDLINSKKLEIVSKE